MERFFVMRCMVAVLWLSLFDYCPSQRAHPQEKASSNKTNTESLCVTIWPKKTRIFIGESLRANLRVANATEKPQSIQVRGSHVIQWKTDNDRVLLSEGVSFSDRIRTIRLEPGEAYETTVELAVDVPPSAKLISFRMAFTPDDFLIPLPPLPGKERSVASRAKAGSNKAAAASKKDEKRIYWSNKVVLGIKNSKHE